MVCPWWSDATHACARTHTNTPSTPSFVPRRAGRFKLPVTVDSLVKSEWLRMYVQLWDADLLTSNDAIGMAELPLARWLKQ